MKVVIIGAGALGKSLAALLADREDVIVYDKNRNIRQALAGGKCILTEKGRRKKARIRTVSSLKQLQTTVIDLLIFATKVMDLKTAVSQAAGLHTRYVFFPQNGLFDIGGVKRHFKNAKICRGTTTMACQEVSSGHAVVFYKGGFYIGGDGSRSIAALFRKAGVGARAYRDPDRCVWAKLIFSSVMNPLPVITGQGYDVLKDDETWALVRCAVEEGRKVAKALGVRLAFDPMLLVDRVRRRDLRRIQHRGSIFQDLSAGRRTELDCITGALIRQAGKLNIATPALDRILKEAKLVGA